MSIKLQGVVARALERQGFTYLPVHMPASALLAVEVLKATGFYVVVVCSHGRRTRSILCSRPLFSLALRRLVKASETTRFAKTMTPRPVTRLSA
ncbi:MAG: hypothetical protein HY397_03985 [Candidatus Doudnabacteria bacterium]|nr:hypothetical protein [Candidatus Doudnabacteria bacterium]